MVAGTLLRFNMRSSFVNLLAAVRVCGLSPALRAARGQGDLHWYRCVCKLKDLIVIHAWLNFDALEVRINHVAVLDQGSFADDY